MSRFGFSRCGRCHRLNIHGARCVCDPLPPMPCDCTFEGNCQILGPKCEGRIHAVWSAVIRGDWKENA